MVESVAQVLGGVYQLVRASYIPLSLCLHNGPVYFLVLQICAHITIIGILMKAAVLAFVIGAAAPEYTMAAELLPT